MKSELQKAIDRLVARDKGWKEFLPKPDAAKIGPSIGVGKPKGSLGTASPDVDKIITTSDGLFTIHVGKIT